MPPPKRPAVEGAMAGFLVVLLVIAAIALFSYVTSDSDDSVTVDCMYDDDSASCTRY
jgi:hypothetical protein